MIVKAVGMQRRRMKKKRGRNKLWGNNIADQSRAARFIIIEPRIEPVVECRAAHLLHS
jgi:hypothetical protein